MTFKELFDLLDWKSLVAFLQQTVVIVLASIFLAFSLFFFIWMIYTLIRGKRQSRLHHEEKGLLADEQSGISEGDIMGWRGAGFLNKKIKDDRTEENSETSERNIIGKLYAGYLNKKAEKGSRGKKNNTEEVEELLATIRKKSSTTSDDSFQENVINNLTTCRVRVYIKYRPERLVLTVAVKEADIAFKSNGEILSWKISMTMLPRRKPKFIVKPNLDLTPAFKQAQFDVLEIYKEMLPELSLRYRLYGSDTEDGTQRLAGEVTVELGELLTANDYLIDDWRTFIIRNTKYKRRKEKYIKKKITFKE